MFISSSASELISARVLASKIGNPASLAALRETVQPLLCDAYLQAKDTIRRQFTVDGNATRAVSDASALVDTVISFLRHVAEPFCKGQEHLAVVAVGGYGRGEQFPFSDVDLLFLYDETEYPADALIEWILYGLWDLGLIVGQSVRTVKESLELAAADVTICTNMLDNRLICGNASLFHTFQASFQTFIHQQSALEFVENKLAERDTRHQRCGDSRYLLEPNIKEGKGGLRDLQTLQWLVKYIYTVGTLDDLVGLRLLTRDELAAFTKARHFLWQVRVHIHYIAGRAEERLTFDMQRAVAQAMGYHDESSHMAVERFMKQYFLVARTVGNLTRSVCAVLEEDKKRKPRASLAVRMESEAVLGGFRVDGERLAILDEQSFAADPAVLLTLFQTAHEHKLDIHPRTLQLVTRHLWRIDGALRRNEQANQAFMTILLSPDNPEHILRKMNDAGVLGRFIPDFGKVIGQMQFDMYHTYTVDEHTLRAIGILHDIEHGKHKKEMPAITRVFPLIKSRRVLYLALFAHDIAKGRGGDHSVLGEVVVRKLGRRFGFLPQEVETCAWLVRHHLLMSKTAFKRDTNDPKTIADFVAAVQSPERLRLLLALTVADIRAVGPTVWNGWKGALLRDLYYRSEAQMGASDAPRKEEEERGLQEELHRLLPGWSDAAIMHYLAQGDTSFWGACDAGTHAEIAALLREAEHTEQPLVMHTRSSDFLAITDIVLCTPDQQGLFSRVSGAIALAGASIQGAKIFTLKNGMAVEMFHIQDINGQAYDKPDKLARLAVYMNKAVTGELDVAKELAAQRPTYPSRMEVFKVPPRVFVENRVSANHTVIEVGGRDRVGFLHAVTKAIADLGLTIATAHISTYGERAVDVFYVKDAFGMKVVHEQRIKQIQDVLMAAIARGTDKLRQAS